MIIYLCRTCGYRTRGQIGRARVFGMSMVSECLLMMVLLAPAYPPTMKFNVGCGLSGGLCRHSPGKIDVGGERGY